MKKQMFLGADHLIFRNAQSLRDNPTHSEIIMWGYLKTKPMGCKFRRQHPISIYVADFYCHSLKLIIEIDGNIHSEETVYKRDIERQKNLEADGIIFLRFTSEEVEKSLETVITAIEKYIQTHTNKNTR